MNLPDQYFVKRFTNYQKILGNEVNFKDLRECRLVAPNYRNQLIEGQRKVRIMNLPDKSNITYPSPECF